MLNNLRKTSEESIKKYEKGVGKIIESENIVKIKKADLNVEKKSLEKEKEEVNNLIKEIEEFSMKTQEAQTKAEILNIEIAKKIEEVSAKQAKADFVVKDAIRFKAEVEQTVEENLDEKKIKAMAGILGNPPEKIKLILMAVACLNSTGQSLDFKLLFGKAAEAFKGIAGFVDKGGAGHKLKKSNLDQAEALLKQLFLIVKKDGAITEMSQLGQNYKGLGVPIYIHTLSLGYNDERLVFIE
jgi:hypothetical protein